MAEPAPVAEALVPSDRQEQILRAVCRDFIVTGDDIASAALVRRHGFRWSSATLRQELAALERMGLLRRAHRSAGCSPTEAGLRHYVSALPPGRVAEPQLISAVDRSLHRLRDDPSRGMRAAVCILSEATGCLAVTFLGTAQDPIRMQQVDAVPLGGSRALVVLTLEGGATYVQPVELEGPVSPDPGAALVALQERLRWLCVGRTLADAREALLRQLHEHEAQVDRLLAQALRVALSLCARSPLDPLWLQIAGQPALARSLADADRLGDVLTLLEDDQRLAEVLDQLLPAPFGDDAPRARVHVGVRGLPGFSGAGHGDPSPNPAFDPILTRAEPGLSLVGCRVPMTGEGRGPDRGPNRGPQVGPQVGPNRGPNRGPQVGLNRGPQVGLNRGPQVGLNRGPQVGLNRGPQVGLNRGVVALLGPARMDYAAMIPLVEYAARALAARMCA